MDPLATNPQNDDIDPLELEDQQLPDEETAELAHIEDPESPENMVSLVDEEHDLHKVLDKITEGVEVPDLEDSPLDQAAAKSSKSATKVGDASVAGEVPVKKSGSHIIPKHLIDRELTAEDLFDHGAL
jgi:hypothetical protein